MFKIEPAIRERFKNIVIFFLIVIWLAIGGSQIWNSSRDLAKIDGARAAAWYNNSWSYRKTITIDYTLVSTTLSNFPVMVSTTDSNLTSYASSTGADILFTSSDGTTKLNHEIESYTSATGKLIAWVQVPSLSASANTVLYMYYGNTGAASQQAATATWDSNFMGVWHLKEDPSGTSPQMKDSTSNAAHASAISMLAATQVDAKINGGLDFNGTDDYTSAPTTSLSITGAITVSLWVNADSLGGTNNPRFVSKNSGTAGTRGWEFTSESGSSNKVGFRVFDSADTTRYLANEASALTTGSWVQYAGVYNPSTAVIIYKNGAQSGIVTSSVPSSQKDTPGNNVLFANRPGANCSTCYLNGKLDEIRISNVVRTSGWILTEYNNESSPSTFYTWGAAEPQPIISIAITSDGSISYGTLSVGTSTTTIALSDTQTATNYGNVAESFTIKGQDTACPWTLTSTAGTDQYVHEFSTSSGSIWTPLTTSYQTLTSTIAASTSQNFDLRISVPTSTSCGTSQSVDVTVQAAAA